MLSHPEALIIYGVLATDPPTISRITATLNELESLPKPKRNLTNTSVYNYLAGLRKQGYVSVEGTTPPKAVRGGRARNTWSITPEGRKALIPFLVLASRIHKLMNQ